MDPAALDNLHNRELRLWFRDGEIVDAVLLGTDPRGHKDLTYEVRRILTPGQPPARGSEPGATLVAAIADLARFETLG